MTYNGQPPGVLNTCLSDYMRATNPQIRSKSIFWLLCFFILCIAKKTTMHAKPGLAIFNKNVKTNTCVLMYAYKQNILCKQKGMTKQETKGLKSKTEISKRRFHIYRGK